MTLVADISPDDTDVEAPETHAQRTINTHGQDHPDIRNWTWTPTR